MISQIAVPGSTHTGTGLSTIPSSANTQLLLPSPLNTARPAAQGNCVMEARGTDINPVKTSSYYKPNMFSISRNLSTLIARCYVSERSPYTHPVLSHFLKYSLCREIGSHGRQIFGLVLCSGFYILSTGLLHIRVFPNLQRQKYSPTLFLRSCFVWVPPSPNGHKHSHSSFCSHSTFSQQSSPELLNITSRVMRDNGSHAPLNSKIVPGSAT